MFMQASRLRMHVEKRHNRRYHCAELGCGATFETWTQLLRHRPTHQNLTCTVCGTVLLTRARFTAHMHTHAPKGHPCPIPGCQKVFSRNTNLRVHIRSAHDQEKPFACPICPQTFAYKKTLDQHMARGHNAQVAFWADGEVVFRFLAWFAPRLITL